jgi:predicted secreted protein
MISGRSKAGVGSAAVFVVLLFMTALLLAQDIEPATDYEWELQTPSRTMFRNRTFVGSVPISERRQSKLPFAKSKTKTLEAVELYTDMAFEPGDTTRYFGANLTLMGKNGVLSLMILDIDELAPFEEALRYLAKTAEGMRVSERTDTQIFFRGKGAWEILFRQQGTEQHIELHFPETSEQEAQQRELDINQVSALADLVNLTMVQLRRQGALLVH